MTADENTLGVLAAIISNLAKGATPSFSHTTSHGAGQDTLSLDGIDDSPAKLALESELIALGLRISVLEARANVNSDQKPPLALDEPRARREPNGERYATPDDEQTGRDPLVRKELGATWLNKMLATSKRSVGQGEEHRSSFILSEADATELKDNIDNQAKVIHDLKETVEDVHLQLKEQKKDNEAVMTRGFQENDALKRELAKHQQANMAFQKALREIGNIVTAVANGDLSKKVFIHSKELDPEITSFKRTINTMVDQLQDFASQVTQLAKEVGTEGRLGGQADLPGVRGIWLELTDNGTHSRSFLVYLLTNFHAVNLMAAKCVPTVYPFLIPADCYF